MMHFCENRSTIMVISFFLFWRPGCSAARNSPACKDKNLRCLRKCRFAYIDTSPALSARRHLTAALLYSARPPHRPSCLHLGCQTHQTWCAPRHLGAAPSSNWSPVQRAQFTTFCWQLRLQSWESFGRTARPRAAHGAIGTECEAVRCGRVGCKGEGRLRCDSK